jgi:hypothetical protein
MHSWTVRGSRPGAISVRRREFAVAGVGWFWPVATLAAAATS